MRSLCLPAALLLGLPFAAGAITVRDDVTDAQSQALAAVSGSAVGNLTRPGDSVSGVLIDPRFVLTAAHVTGGAAQNAFTFAIGSSTYQSVRYVVNPAYTGDSASGHDLAIIELDREVTDVAPALLYNGTAEVGVEATVVGFGIGGNGTSGGTLPRGVKRAATNVIDSTSYLTFTSNRLLFIDFDAVGVPASILENKTGTPTATTFEGLIALFDSGGGVFGTIGGQNYLLGINSFVIGDSDNISFNYGDVGGATRISSNYAFITGVIPEPSTAALAAMGAAMIGFRRRRQQRLS